LGDLERSSPRAVPAPVGEKSHGLLLQLLLQPVGDVRLLAQHRTADRGAVDREVHARLVIGAFLAQRLVLDAVERELAAEEREEFVLEGIAEYLAEIPDRLDVGVAREDLLYSERVISVDQ